MEREMLAELKAQGATTIAVSDAPAVATLAAADLAVELRLDVPELVRLPAVAIVGQLLGYHIGMKKSLDPDRPQHLSRVVTL